MMMLSGSKGNPSGSPSVKKALPPLFRALQTQLREEYLQASIPSQMKSLRILLKEFIDPYALHSPETQQVLRTLFESTIGLGYINPWLQPPVQFRISFIRYFIKQIESCNLAAAMVDFVVVKIEEILQDWYEELGKLSTAKVQSEPFYRLYDLFLYENENNDQIPIKILETEGGAFVSEGTTGLVTWEASIELSKWLIAIQNSNSIPNNSGLSLCKESIKWILELGSGCGLLAVAGVKTFPKLKKYIATDGSKSTLEKCRENYIVNFGSLDDSIHFEELDWVTDFDKFKLLVERCTNEFGRGLLLGADIVFDKTLIPPLLNLVRTFQDVQTQTAHFGTSLLSCTVRNEGTMAILRKVLEQERLENRTVHSWENGFVLECSLIL